MMNEMQQMSFYHLIRKKTFNQAAFNLKEMENIFNKEYDQIELIHQRAPIALIRSISCADSNVAHYLRPR